ncbi:MAG: hypothetical protein KGS09_20860 [Nitrospirae bacterium]|nr:hypothetical protein [Nitrospirota bacterium]
MNNPDHNPTTHPGLSGRSRRHVLRSSAIRTIRSDHTTEHNLVTLRGWLDGQIKKGDVVSVSMVARRAIAVYTAYLKPLAEMPGGLDGERGLVRQGTRLPNVRGSRGSRKKK